MSKLVVDLTGDDRATILGALIWIADKLRSDDAERAKTHWAEKGKEAFAAERRKDVGTVLPGAVRWSMTNGRG